MRYMDDRDISKQQLNGQIEQTAMTDIHHLIVIKIVINYMAAPIFPRLHDGTGP